MKILVIDDDPSIRRLYREDLEDDGYEVAEASSGGQALTDIGKIKPDIIILDILMPGIDGVQTLRKIKQHMPDMPVIISSAYDYHEDIMVYSPDSYVLKSSDTAELKKTVKSLLRQEEM